MSYIEELEARLDEIKRLLGAFEERLDTAVATRDAGLSNYEIEQRLAQVEDKLRHLEQQLRDRRAREMTPYPASLEEAARDLG